MQWWNGNLMLKLLLSFVRGGAQVNDAHGLATSDDRTFYDVRAGLVSDTKLDEAQEIVPKNTLRLTTLDSLQLHVFDWLVI